MVYRQPYGECQLQRKDMSNLNRKLNKLGKLYELRNRIQNKKRFGVKERWNGNTGYSFFRDLRESLQSTNYEKLENLKRSSICEHIIT